MVITLYIKVLVIDNFFSQTAHGHSIDTIIGHNGKSKSTCSETLQHIDCLVVNYHGMAYLQAKVTAIVPLCANGKSEIHAGCIQYTYQTDNNSETVESLQ